MNDPAVSELIAAATRGDQQAWAQLYGRYQPLVSRMVRGYRLSPSDADDVAQIVWLRVVEHLPRIRHPSSLAGWIATTTRKEALRTASAAHRGSTVGPLESESDGEEIPPLHVELRSLLGELPPHQSALMALLLGEPELSYEQISGRLGMPVGTIGPTRARALTKLRARAPERMAVRQSHSQGENWQYAGRPRPVHVNERPKFPDNRNQRTDVGTAVAATVVEELIRVCGSPEAASSVTGRPLATVVEWSRDPHLMSQQETRLAGNVIDIGVVFSKVWHISLYSPWLTTDNAHLDFARPIDMALDHPDQVKQAILAAAFGVYA